MINFASDNWAPAHPLVLKAVADANSGPAPAYGNDEWTHNAQEAFKNVFGPEAHVFPVFTGTAANVLSVASTARQNQYMLCADTAHLHVDEAGASERFAGCKLFAVQGKNGKLRADAIEPHLERMQPHEGQVGAVSITQCTEFGTTYHLAETKAISELCRERGLPLHVDGARIANAAAFLGGSLNEAVQGADVLSFGGTKNGLMGAEAVVFLNPELAEGFAFTRLQGMQLASKMRFLSAQLLAYLDSDLWLKNARHANEMAQRLEEKIRDVADLNLLYPVEANILFAKMPKPAIDVLQKTYAFYELDAVNHVARFVTSWNTSKEDVDAFAEAIQKAVR